MNLVDANVLLYAVNVDSRHHQSAKTWLDTALSGGATVGFSWIVLVAFLRLATKAGLFPRPLTAEEASDRVEAWLASSAAVVVEPTSDHATILRRLLHDVGVGGNLVSDAHLAALAIEHKAVVVSYDNDFDRFPGVRWEMPSEG